MGKGKRANSRKHRPKTLRELSADAEALSVAAIVKAMAATFSGTFSARSTHLTGLGACDISPRMHPCPECGAPDALCQSRFDEFLALEFSDPGGYGFVHNLTVAAYMVQHSSRLTREGWLFERSLLREFLIEGKSPALARQESREALDSGKRQFKIKSTTGQPVIAKTDWKKTICDVRDENAEVYCADVEMWARAALEEAEKIEFSRQGRAFTAIRHLAMPARLAIQPDCFAWAVRSYLP